MMLDFICELELVLSQWPVTTAMTLGQIADQTSTSVPQVVDFLCDVLDRELEVHESITQAEATQALATLKDRMSVELEARQRRIEQRRDKAIKTYDLTMDKVRALLATKNWRAAYRTLSYFVGGNEKDLPEDLLVSLCGECLRLGTKGGANLQEMSLWLRKAIAACTRVNSADSIDDALDFLDAYGEYFADDGDDRGRRLLTSVLGEVRLAAVAHNLSSRYDGLVKEFRIA